MRKKNQQYNRIVYSQGFLSLSGATGPQGLPGEHGEDGKPGILGPPGLQGLPGSQGRKGKQNINCHSSGNVTVADINTLSVVKMEKA